MITHSTRSRASGQLHRFMAKSFDSLKMTLRLRHIHETAVVALERNCYYACWAVAVFGNYEVGFTGTW